MLSLETGLLYYVERSGKFSETFRGNLSVQTYMVLFLEIGSRSLGLALQIRTDSLFRNVGEN